MVLSIEVLNAAHRNNKAVALRLLGLLSAHTIAVQYTARQDNARGVHTFTMPLVHGETHRMRVLTSGLDDNNCL